MIILITENHSIIINISSTSLPVRSIRGAGQRFRELLSSLAFSGRTAGEHSIVISSLRIVFHSHCVALQCISEPLQFQKMLVLQKRPATDGRASEQRSTDGACERFRELPSSNAFSGRTAGEYSTVRPRSGSEKLTPH